jgi:pimeloyl-ACP methyl ester carboxylesterase
MTTARRRLGPILTHPPRPGRRATAASAAAAAAGLAAAGAGLVARRRSAATRPLPPGAVDLLGDLPGERTSVRADDGCPLDVVRTGDGPVTVIFVHGYCVDRRCWHYQWRSLGQWRDGSARLVAYDQRSHGRSGRSRADRCTIDQLGQDLRAVMDTMAPSGPVVVVGHSMGGMTIMALADAFPEIFGDRIVGVALVSTSAGKLSEATYGLPAGLSAIGYRLAPWVLPRLTRRAHLVDAGRKANAAVGVWLTKRYSFASEVPPERMALMATLIESTPFAVMAEFFPAFANHNKLKALGVLKKVPTLVLVGDHDLQTPPDHSRSMAAELATADLVVVPRAGHMVMLEHPDTVNAALAGLLERACPR